MLSFALVTFTTAGVAAAAAAAAAPVIIPIQRTPVYGYPSIEVQVGNPLQTLRLEPNFRLSNTYLAHPGVCEPFVPCLALDKPIDHPDFYQALDVEFIDGGGKVDGVEPLVFSTYSEPSAPVKVVLLSDTGYARPELAGTLGLSPVSAIAQSNVIEVNPETIIHPDGSTESGMSIQLHPSVIVDYTTDVIAPLTPGVEAWRVQANVTFAGIPIENKASLHVIFESAGSRQYFELKDLVFAAVVDQVREAVGSVHVVHQEYKDQLFVPCLGHDDDEEQDPLAGLFSFQFGHDAEVDIELHINIRHTPDRDCYPPVPAPKTHAGIQYCPTLLVNTRTAWGGYMMVVPEMFDEKVQTFLDAGNHHVVFRPTTGGPRDPLPAAPVALLKSFDLPDPSTGSIEFVVSTGGLGVGWRLLSARPRRFGDLLEYTFEFYGERSMAPGQEFPVLYFGEFTLVGNGNFDISDPNPASIRLPVALGGLGRRYRISQRLNNGFAVYTLTPIAPLAPIV